MLDTKLINQSTMVNQAKGAIVSDMAGEKVMLSVKNGKYYNLGNIGGAIWDYIESPLSVIELVQKLKEVFEVDTEECNKEVTIFLEQLYSEGLIEIKN
jgi:hypothetical protein